MFSRTEWIARCRAFPGAYEDYPFDEDRNAEAAWTVMRHRGNRRSFALLFERGGFLNINVKCEPMEAQFLRQVYPCVTPAYHMNKEHWNGIRLDGSVPDPLVEEWITASYRLTAPKRKMKKQP